MGDWEGIMVGWSDQIKMVLSKEFRNNYERKQEQQRHEYLNKLLSKGRSSYSSKEHEKTGFQFRKRKLFRFANEKELAHFCKENYFQYNKRSGWQLTAGAPSYLRNMKQKMDSLNDVRLAEYCGSQKDILSKMDELHNLVTMISLGIHQKLLQRNRKLESLVEVFKKQVALQDLE